jgi:predicted  nucleic acid-binding Zn-ribbon protein
MEEFIARLLDLQDCDRDIDRLKADLESIPREIKIHKKDTKGHETRFSQFTGTLEEIREKQKKLAGDRADNVNRVADYKTRLVSLKSNTEYTAMLQQIANTERMNDQIDNLIIEAMYEEDEAVQKLERARKERDRAVKRSLVREESLKDKLRELEQKLEILQARRNEIASGVEPKSLKIYEKARSSGRREVVAGIVHGSCGGCLTKVPSQKVGEIKGGKTYTCPLCGSYVVWTSDSSF